MFLHMETVELNHEKKQEWSFSSTSSSIVFWSQTGNPHKPTAKHTETQIQFTSNRKWHPPTNLEENGQTSNRNNDSMNVKPQIESYKHTLVTQLLFSFKWTITLYSNVFL